MRALDGEYLLDDLVDDISNVELKMDSLYLPKGNVLESYAMQIDLEFEEQSATSIYPHLLDAVMVKLLSSYSAWSTTGSERVSPCIFTVQNLPSVSRLPAMLDGNWHEWGWQQPYQLNM